MHNRPDYRIRPNKKTEDDFQEQIEEQLKLSTHLKGQRRENSAALVRKPQESGTNSRLGESRTGSGIGSMVGSRVGRVLRMSKVDKNTVTDIEFNNVRWISIVSAYDSKRLRHVTVSKQSCQAFLKRYGYGIKKDPAAMAYLRDIKRHFHSWLAKINQTFTIVLDHFLSTNQKSPLLQLQQVGPTLEEIRSDTAMMRQKLEGCLKIYENNDFRKLSQRFQGFFTYSKGLEELIAVIFQSKQRIDGLFVELQESDHMDKKVEKIRKEGVKQAKKLVYQDGDFNKNLCQRIMEKVSLAINDMAVKSMDIFNRIQGARDILNRLRKFLNESHKRGLTITEIRTLSKIFKEIIDEAEKFQKFAQNYGSQGELISAELKEKIRQYQQDIEDKKRAVSQIQVIFVSTVINETIDTLKHNFNINNCIEQSKITYQEYNHILDEISDAMLDQTRKASVDGLVKHGRTAFTRLEQVFEKIKRTLRRNEDGVVIDTEEGLISVDCYVKEIKDYKDKIKNLIKKHEDGLRHLQANFKEVRLPNSDKDQEMNFLLRLAGEVEVINGRDRKNKLAAEKGFLQLRGGVAAVGAEAEQAYFLMQQLEDSKQKIKSLNEANPLPNLIKSIHLENNIYLQSSYINKLFQICSKTIENNLIQQLSKLNDINSKRKQQLEKNSRYHITKSYQFLVDRIYCLILVKGLKKNVIKELDENKNILFPNNEFETKQMENEIKYRGLLIDNLGEGSILAKGKIKSAVLVMKDMVGSYRIVERLHLNENGQFFVLVETLANFASQMFKVCLLSDSQDRSTECRKIAFQLVKSLKNKLNNIELLDRQIDIQTHEAVFRVRKEILLYQQINQTALKAGEELTKPQNNDPLSSFASFIHTLSEYILQSKQISYIALNQYKQPIWIGIPQQSVEGLVNQINLKGYKRGIFVEQYNREAPKVKSAEVKPEVSPSKEAKSGKKDESPTGRGSSNIKIKVQTHPQEDMDEQIPVQSDKDEAPQEMAEDMVDQINDEPAEQMVEEMEEYMPDEIGDQMGEDIINDEEENMGDQIDDYDATPKKSNKKEEKPAQKSQIKEKPVEIIKEEPKKQEPVISQYEKSIYEIIPFFKELSQMKELFAKINTSQHNFWATQVDFGQVEDFFHRNEDNKDRANFIKSLENSFVMFANQNFGTPLADEIKKLDRFRTLKAKFNELGSKDWESLFTVLQLIELNYSLLYKKGGKDEILQIFIGNRNGNEFRKQGNKKCITNYLQRSFKSTYYFPAMFNTQGYINYCFKQETLEFINANGVSFHYVVKYTNKFNQSLPASDTHSALKALQDLEHRFTEQFVTGVDLHHFCLQLWLKAIDSQAEDHYKPNYSVLAEYTNKLNSLDKKEWIANYLTQFNKEANDVKNKVKSFKNSLENILFKVDSQNIFQCIAQVAGIFKKTIARQVYAINSSGKQQLIFVSSSQKVSAVFEQSQTLNIIESCLSRNEEKGNKVVIKLSDMVKYIQKLFTEGYAKTDNLPIINELLNILHIEHFYICQPEFLIKEKLDDIVFRVLKHLRVKTREELQYDEMFKDIFVVTKKEFTSEVKLKPTFNKKMLTQDYIAAIEDRTLAITKELTIHQESFKNTLLNNKMSALMLSKVVFKREENPILKELAAFKSWLQAKTQEIESQLSNKSVNPLAYVHINCKNIENIKNNVSRQMREIESLQIPTKDGHFLQQIRETNKLIEQIKLWFAVKGIVNTSSSFYANVGDEKLIMGVDLNKSKTDKSRAKEFLIEILEEQWLSTTKQSKKDWLQVFEFFYGQYVEENITIEKRDGHVDFNFNFKAVCKAFFADVRLDLVETEDVILFSKNYNLHRFNSSNTTVEKLKNHHTKIIKRLLLRLSLLKVKELVNSCEWVGLNKLETSRSLLDCAVKEIDQDLVQLEEFIRKTQQIKLKQTDLSGFSQWYKNLAVKKLGFQYYQLKSSEGELITILPMIKIEKDKAKNANEINTMLADIKLPPNYSIKLQQGISVIHLQNEKIFCNLVDNEHYLTQDSQLNTFQPEINESEMLLLAFYQIEAEEEVIPLFIGEIKLKVECNLTITECYTMSSVSGAIWRIGKEDYKHYRADHHTDTKESLKILKKKIRGVSSPHQKMKQVSVGQTLSFIEVGGWLREELKNHHRRVQEKERAEQERRRIQAMLKKEAEDFLANIYEGLDKQNLPVLKFTLQELQAIRGKTALTRPKRFNSYSQRIVQKTNKIIESIEQNKSREQVGRLSAITRDYMKGLEERLIINHDIENEMFENADKKFKVIKTKREKEAEQRRIKEEEERKKKEEEKRIKEEAKKKKAEQKRLKLEEAKRLKQEKKKKEQQQLKRKQEQLKAKIALEAQKALNALNVNPNFLQNKPQQPTEPAKTVEDPKIQTVSPKPTDSNPVQTNEPIQDAEQISSDSQQVNQVEQKKPTPIEPEEIHTEDLVLEHESPSNAKSNREEYDSYLIEILQDREPKDADYYRCIISSFWQLTVQERQSIVLLH